MQQLDTAIVWFRRDLRVDDNPALTAALAAARHVVPLFIWAPEEEGQFQPGRTSRWWTQQSVVDLQNQLAALGSTLILRRSAERSKGLMQAVQDVKAQAVFFNNLYDPISMVSDHEIKQALAGCGVLCKSFNSDMLYEPWEVLDDENKPCTTFEDFWGRVALKQHAPPIPLPPPPFMPPLPCFETPLESLSVSTMDWFMTKEQAAASDQLRFKWKPGVAGALAKLEAFFTGKLPVFDHERAKVDRESTSQLSPWIHIGSISIRVIFYKTKQYEMLCAAAGINQSQSCTDFLRQMGYREYARYLAFFFPFIHERSLLAHLRHCPWRLDQVAFKAWRQGQTGYPLVDAAMKQLWSTGWAHNRLRVVAASFAVKNLLLPWQWGLKHFWDAQLDADLENDALGWQYISGGMADAHPFSFLVDLDAECRRLDPDGEYVRRWLPALALLPTEYIHAPWTAPQEVLEAADVELGTNYPKPIISIHNSILGLQHAVEVLDAASAVASSEHTTRHPYRMPHNLYQGMPQASHAATSVYGDTSLGVGAVARSLATPGTTEATEVHFNYASGSNSADPRSGASNGSQQLQGRMAFRAQGDGTGTSGLAGSMATPTATEDGKQQQQQQQRSGAGAPGVAFDYPRYRQAHDKHKGYYIDVRLVPSEAMQAAVAAEMAAEGHKSGKAAAPFQLVPIPGMQDEALKRAALGNELAQDDYSGLQGGRVEKRRGRSGGADVDVMSEGGSGSSSEEECESEVVSNTVGLSMPRASMMSGWGQGRKRGNAGEEARSPAASEEEEVEGEADSQHPAAERGRWGSKCARRLVKEGTGGCCSEQVMEGEGEASAGGCGVEDTDMQAEHEGHASKRIHL